SRRRNYFNWLKNNWGSQATDHPSDEDYAYAIPEFFREQFVPKEFLDRCDQYLLGLLGYHMLTGMLPARDGLNRTRAPKSVAEFGVLKPIRLTKSGRLCPKALAEPIMRMASLEPSRRFESVADALRELTRFGEESLALAKESYRRVVSVKN